MNWTDVAFRLAVPFDPSEINFRASSLNADETQALAVAYIDVHTVQDRLDGVVGVDGWRDRFELLADGTVLCGLSLRVGANWIEKCDVGGQSPQKDPGHRRKASFTDALKRAAVKWGIGRYLTWLPRSWCGYDKMRKQLTSRPALPAWALPAAAGRRPDPATGAELAALLFDQESAPEAAKGWRTGELLAYVARQVAHQLGKPPGPIGLWPRELIPAALGHARQFAREHRPAAAS